MGLSDYNFFS